jgi:hypothetical protein
MSLILVKTREDKDGGAKKNGKPRALEILKLMTESSQEDHESSFL